MDHPNILHFIGAEKHLENMQVDYWLITDYHDRGSLCDFLKAHTLSWSQLCTVVETMAKGTNIFADVTKFILNVFNFRSHALARGNT